MFASGLRTLTMKRTGATGTKMSGLGRKKIGALGKKRTGLGKKRIGLGTNPNLKSGGCGRTPGLPACSH